MAICTSSHTKSFLLKTSMNTDLIELFDGNIICGDNSKVINGKPSPDIFLHGLRMISSGVEIHPDNVLVFEDSPSGVMAGLNALMKVVWIPDVNLELDQSISDRCTEVMFSMESFDPAKYGLPLFD